MSEDKRRRLYDQGLSDEVIAKRCGVARVTITAWRLSRGLPVNKHPPHQLSKAEERRRMALWKKGLPDVLIAEEVGLTPGAIMRWRQRHGLKGHDYTKWKRAQGIVGRRRGKTPTRRGARTRASPAKRRTKATKRKRPASRSAPKRPAASKRRTMARKRAQRSKKPARKR